MRNASAALVLLCGLTACRAATVAAPGPPTPPADDELRGLAHIREPDLRRDLFALSGDDMRGREAGTIDELRASVWVAERAREAGLEPAGDDGTYFQFFPLRRTRQSSASQIALDGAPLVLARDAAIIGLSDASIDAPIVWLDTAAEHETAAVDLTGKVAAARLAGPPAGAQGDVSLAAWRYANGAVNQLVRRLRERAAAAVIVVSDPYGDAGFDRIAAGTTRGRYALDDGTAQAGAAQAPAFFLPSSMRARVAGATRLTARLTIDNFVYPSVNVVAKVSGTDPILRDEYVLFSAHQDHDGVRTPVAGDSIWNGADDNATTSVALLAIGRAFAGVPGRRSALFVWHGAEEKGLFGSRWHAERPRVPRESIVAVLNGDMLGRNHPDTAALLGVIPPHRNSSELASMALAANQRVTGFAVDSTWDSPTHREGWYFRSDHLPYARLNVPALFFTSLLHSEYHTPRDGPETIDLAKLTRMTQWMYATGWAVANAPVRPRVDPGFRLER